MKKIVVIFVIVMFSALLISSGCITPEEGEKINTADDAQKAVENVEKDIQEAESLLNQTLEES
jgi:hypothetical protein